MKCTNIAKLVSWMFPTKDDRNAFREFCKNLDEKKNLKIIHSRYVKILERLRNKAEKEKINVIFLANDNSKWCYRNIYETLEKSGKYNVKILLTVSRYLLKKRYSYMNYKEIIQKNYEYFKNAGFNVDFAFDTVSKKYLNLSIFKPDIIFYEQPWDLPDIHSIYETSKYALALYCSYGSCITNGENEYCKPFFNEVYTYFVDNEDIIETMKNHGITSSNLEFAGQVKLDAYLKHVDTNNIIWKTENKKRVIWAPHHSFYKGSMLGFGTFDWNYGFFLDYARKHQEFEFILKPHPELKCQIVHNNLMTLEEMNKYFKEWENLPNAQIYDKGSYFDMFRTSDILITDCNSFLYEYLPSCKPVIQLLSERSVGHNSFGRKITEGYYKVRNTGELEEMLGTVFEEGNDTLYQKRCDIIKNTLKQPEGGTALYITKYINKLIREKQ